MLLAEDAPGDYVIPSLVQKPFRRRCLAVELRPVGTERERVLVFPVWVVRAENQKLRRAALDAARVEDRQFFTGLVVQNMVGGPKVVTQGLEQLSEPLPLQAHAGFVSAFTAKVLTKLQVGASQGTQGLVGRARSILTLGRGIPPAGGGFLNVSRKDF